MRKTMIAVCCATYLTGCNLAPTYHRPDVDYPNSYHSSSAPLPEQVQRVESNWWLNYKDPVLTQLIEQAFRHNQDLAAAVARMDDSAAQARIARNGLLPSISTTGQSARRVGSSSDSSSGGVIYDSYTIGANISWELDLWGKLRNINHAAQARFLSSAYNLEAVKLSLAAQVAQTYFQLLAADSSLKLTEETEQSRKETFDLQTKSFNAGNISMLEVEQARAEWGFAQLSKTQKQLAVKTTESALNVLLGQQPHEFLQTQLRGISLDKLTIPLNTPEGIPSDLLLRRPDLAVAEQELIAANANIGVARSAYFPSIQLTGSMGGQSSALSNLFTGPAGTWSFVGSLAAPLFNFGTTKANVDSASAKQRLAVALYQKTVQTSFQDVLDSIRTVDSLREQTVFQRKQTESTKEALHLVNLRYENGYSGYLDVLDTQRNAFSVQLQAINTQLTYLNATVNLYKALGGGWQLDAK